MPILWNATKCNKNALKSRCLIHEMLQNAKAEATECYEMIYKMI